MKVLLIWPPTSRVYGDLKDSAPAYPPLGLAYIAAMLEKEKHDVKILDLEVNPLDKRQLVKIIDNYSPDIIGFSAVTPTIEFAYDLIDFLKSQFKKIIFIIGGVHATAFPGEALLHADIVVRGEGEITITELAAKKPYKKIDGISYKYNNKIIHNKPRALIENLDEIPYPARYLLPMKKYHYLSKKNITNIIMSRGCFHQCNFCNKNIFGNVIRGRNVENIMGEIDELVTKYNVNEIHISDDCFNYNQKKTLKLAEQLRKYKIKFFPHAGVRVDSVNSEQLSKLKQAGFYGMSFGVESGNQQILNNIKKGITLQQIRDAFKIAHKVNFEEIWAYFMFGLKGETLQTAKETIKFSIELSPTIAKFHIVVPYPDTEYFNELKKENRLKVKNWSDYGLYSEPVFEHENITSEQLIKIHKEAYRKFFFRIHAVSNILKTMIRKPDKIFPYFEASLDILKLGF